VVYDEKMVKNYVIALCSELKNFSGLKVDTVYFGGGTPAILKSEQLNKIVEAIYKNYILTPNCEMTIESNPKTLDKKKVKQLREMGFNRASLGIQSFNDKELKTLGRIHKSKDAIDSFNLLKQDGFENIGLDLIFGIPGQTLNSWKNSLQRAISLSPYHISTYSLTIEEKTKFYQLAKQDKIKLPSDEKVRQMYLWAIDYLNLKGYKQYEISNFSLPGFESKHNLKYWNHREYLGFGASAHSFYKNKRWANTKDVKEYIKSIKKSGQAVEFKENLSKEQLVIETIFLGLRKIQGIDLKKFHKDFGVKLEDIKKDKIDYLIKTEFLSKQNDFLRLTKKALPVTDWIILELV
jgi:oxygen-independent coproporphyrinogen-3 oxidase